MGESKKSGRRGARTLWQVLAVCLLACGGEASGDGNGSSSGSYGNGLKPSATKSELSYQIDEDTSVELELPFEDPGDGPMVFRGEELKIGSVRYVNGKAFYVPHPNAFGDESFKLLAANRNGTAEVAVKVQVAPVNDAPLVAGDEITVARGESVEFRLRAGDIEEQPLTFEITQQPRHGAITGEAPHLTYTPEPTYRGSDSLRFRVSDGELQSAVATIQIRVTGSTRCGDGIKEGREECDDGNSENNDECRNDCTLPKCGDSIVDPGEECDDGNDENNDECRSDCTLPKCGDSIVDPGEECDDGNSENGDGCSATCQNE